jgi:hypothetical protein
VVAPLLALVLVAAAMSLFVKPAMAYSRPMGFTPAMEPSLIGFLHERIGQGLGFPSGNTVRQVLLCCAVFALLNHPEARRGLSPRSRTILRWLNVLLVILVMVVRPVVGSHSLFDAAAASPSGSSPSGWVWFL